jgi:AcrR family transcriptional regulator
MRNWSSKPRRPVYDEISESYQKNVLTDLDHGQRRFRCSKMMCMTANKKPDRRTQRTRHQLNGALVDLIKEKRFDDITVQNVIDRAGVGRSTFYSHFRDKEDVFEQQWEQFIERLAGQINWAKAGTGSFVPVRSLFHHLQEAQSFYRGLVRSGKIDSIFKSGIENLSHKIEAALRRSVIKPRIPIPILSHYLASELFALLKWWLDAGMPYTPESMDEIFHRLINPSFKSALRNADAKS